MQAGHLKHNDITSKIIGCAMKIHTYFGPGFPEIIYHRGTALELSKILKDVESEVEREIYYEKTLLGKRRLDLSLKRRYLLNLKLHQYLKRAGKRKF